MNGSASAGASRRRWLSSLTGSLLFSTRFVTIWVATIVLLIVCQIIAPQTLSSDSMSTLLPLATITAIAALGPDARRHDRRHRPVGRRHDLAAARTSSSASRTGRTTGLLTTVLVVLAVAIVIGLVNGVLIAIVGLNPLIVTLAVGLVLGGVTQYYRLGTANESEVPPALSNWVFEKPLLGVSWVFWAGIVFTVLLALLLRSTPAGRRFQAVGANPRAAWIAGIHVKRNVVAAYVGSAMCAGIAAIFLAGVINNPGTDPGQPYLFGPIAAVVLAGTSLTGGLSSVTSTWVAAFALTLLNQMLRVLGLNTAFQFIVFGGAIIIGMVVSGDRIAGILGRLLQRPRFRTLLGEEAR